MDGRYFQTSEALLWHDTTFFAKGSVFNIPPLKSFSFNTDVNLWFFQSRWGPNAGHKSNFSVGWKVNLSSNLHTKIEAAYYRFKANFFL